MGSVDQPRLPLRPLLVAAAGAVHLRPRNLHDDESSLAYTHHDDVAAWFDVDRRSLLRFLRDGVPLCTAERMCDAAGIHPTEAWGRTYHEVCDAFADERRARERETKRAYRSRRRERERGTDAVVSAA